MFENLKGIEKIRKEREERLAKLEEQERQLRLEKEKIKNETANVEIDSLLGEWDHFRIDFLDEKIEPALAEVVKAKEAYLAAVENYKQVRQEMGREKNKFVKELYDNGIDIRELNPQPALHTHSLSNYEFEQTFMQPDQLIINGDLQR